MYFVRVTCTALGAVIQRYFKCVDTDDYKVAMDAAYNLFCSQLTDTELEDVRLQGRGTGGEPSIQVLAHPRLWPWPGDPKNVEVIRVQ